VNESGVLERRDSRSIPSGTREVRAFVVVRDELARLPFMLEHHRRLGVDRFFVVDNGSTDGTSEHLRDLPDVHVFWTDVQYRNARLGIAWLEVLLEAFGRGSWCLLLDADEQFVYPNSETVALGRFCETLDAKGLNCLATMFVDLYADAPIKLTQVTGNGSLLDRCRYFDRQGYHYLTTQAALVPRVYGGPRARLFWPDVDLSRTLAQLSMAGRQAFSESHYLAANADVRLAIADGVFDSGLEHFLSYGWREGRAVVMRPVPDWPEDRYVSSHADVQAAIASGVVESGLEHFVRYGQFESRLLNPWPPCLSQVPLVRWQDGMRLRIGRHSLSGASWRRRDAVGGALLHFRLMADAAGRAHASSHTTGGSPKDGSWTQENDRYAVVLASSPALSAISELSVEYEGVSQLVDLGLIRELDEL
jgi:hypothetical protein